MLPELTALMREYCSEHGLDWLEHVRYINKIVILANGINETDDYNPVNTGVRKQPR